MSRFWRASFVLVSSVFSTCAAASIPHSAVCKGGQVDRQMLAEYLMDTFHFSWRAESSQLAHATGDVSNLPVRQQLIAEGFKCSSSGDRSCSKSDADAVVNAKIEVASILMNQVIGFRSDGRSMDAKEYFTNTEAVIVCVDGASSINEESDGRVSTSTRPEGNDDVLSQGALRVRGGADQMYVRSSNSQAFSGVDKFQAGFSDDKANGKTTKKFVGDIGYGFLPPNSGTEFWQIVPYVGINDNSTNVSGKGRTYTGNTRNAGTVVAYQWTPGSESAQSTAYVVTLRPDYLWNKGDSSRLFSLNGSFVPYVMKWVNAPVNDVADDYRVSTVFDVRSDYGHYTSKGTVAPGNLDDYLRLGSRFGFSISALADKDHPLDWLVTATLLHGFRGDPGNIHYFKSTLSLGFDKKKNLSLDLSYSTGRREDTGEAERGWSLSFGAKY